MCLKQLLDIKEPVTDDEVVALRRTGLIHDSAEVSVGEGPQRSYLYKPNARMVQW